MTAEIVLVQTTTRSESEHPLSAMLLPIAEPIERKFLRSELYLLLAGPYGLSDQTVQSAQDRVAALTTATNIPVFSAPDSFRKLSLAHGLTRVAFTNQSSKRVVFELVPFRTELFATAPTATVTITLGTSYPQDSDLPFISGIAFVRIDSTPVSDRVVFDSDRSLRVHLNGHQTVLVDLLLPLMPSSLVPDDAPVALVDLDQAVRVLPPGSFQRETTLPFFGGYALDARQLFALHVLQSTGQSIAISSLSTALVTC